MFVRYFVELSLPFPEVEEGLLRSPLEWVPGLAREAQARGEVLLAEVGFGPPGRRMEKGVEIKLGRPERLGSRTLVPMSWRPTWPGALFPTLEADLELAPLGPARTQLGMSALYRPPLGQLGRAIDRALLHRVAEATLKDFLDRAAEVLEQLVGSAARPRS